MPGFCRKRLLSLALLLKASSGILVFSLALHFCQMLSQKFHTFW